MLSKSWINFLKYLPERLKRNKGLTLCERIRLVRGNRSLDKFALDLCREGVSFEKSNLSKYEKGTVKPSTEFYVSMMEKEEINLNWLLANVGHKYLEYH